MSRRLNKRQARERRHRRVRAKVFGTPDRPRLSVYRSLSHIYAQVVDDTKGCTLASASTIDPDLRPELAEKNKSDQARAVGEKIAERALAQDISQVVFDRGGYKYHGRVKALADASRKAGLEF